MVNKHSVGGSRLLLLDPIADSVPEYRKHFSFALGLPITPLDTPYYEGTGALYFRLSSNTKHIALLTCAHVIHPPPIFSDNKGMKHTSNSQPKEYMVALGAGGYTTTISDIMAEIKKLQHDINVWNRQLERDLPVVRRNEITREVNKATNRINQLNEFHSEVTKHRSHWGRGVIYPVGTL